MQEMKTGTNSSALRSGQGPDRLAMMSLHSVRVAALLDWVNSTKVCPDPLNDLSQLQDCSVFLRIIHKMSKEGESVLSQLLPERISFIHGFLQEEMARLCLLNQHAMCSNCVSATPDAAWGVSKVQFLVFLVH
ncbi:nuclear mitotic apparatus protein 1 isoform X3 [Taeniopygia guttata]|uniref:nuclear mitotic apparatus protein 1 isoform X3 n=1 Tax=Taeniopygia guttata TaxID=59729 RepID=UPI003BB97F11